MSACSDNASVVIFDKNIAHAKIECMKLRVWPPDKEIEAYLSNRYIFDTNCTYMLEVSTKNDITCNSNQNIQTKALGAFPTSYLKMEVLQEERTLYSYYRDIKSSVTLSDVESACERIGKDLVFFSK